MPELPEVETIKRQLAPLVVGRKLVEIDVLDSRWSRPLGPIELADALQGRRILELGRRGKYLLWSFSGDVHLAQHLRMTGAVLCDPKPEPTHVRVQIKLSGKRRLVIVDPRRFGTGELLLGSEAVELFFASRLGLEPLDPGFTPEHLQALAKGRTTPIKSFLLDQRRLAGVGNIYADEALFRARIHPLRPAGKLTLAEHVRLQEALIEALNAGIEARGATIDDFRHVNGVIGSFQDEFMVHRRENEPCPRCGRTIVKMVVGGRGTYVCERCQPRPRAVRRGDPTPRPPEPRRSRRATPRR